MLLEVNGINTFLSRKQILKNISFNIDKGEIVGLVGQNGAGKTTIMKSIMGLIPVKSGSVLLSGRKVTFANHKQLSKARALIENPAFYDSMTGMQHLKLYAMGEKVDDVQLEDIIRRTGISEFVNRNVKTYSLGMRQRLSIAITLISKPDLIILDEPVNGLDPKSTHEIRELIRELSESDGISFLISSHLLDELSKTANRFVMIDGGEKIISGTLEEISEKLENDPRTFVQTNNDMLAYKILRDNGFDVAQTTTGLDVSIKEKSVHELMIALIAERRIEVTSFTQSTPNLEDAFLKLLENRKEREEVQ